MKKPLSTLATVSLLLGTPNILITHAQSPSLLTQRNINCSSVENLGNAIFPAVREQVNAKISGRSYRINRRKTLVINNVESISFQDCEISIDLDVTLKRKIRRDAHGTVKLRSTIESFNLAEREVCYTNLRVFDVSLSHTLSVGENFYQWVTNLVLPDSGCLQGEDVVS